MNKLKYHELKELHFSISKCNLDPSSAKSHSHLDKGCNAARLTVPIKQQKCNTSCVLEHSDIRSYR